MAITNAFNGKSFPDMTTVYYWLNRNAMYIYVAFSSLEYLKKNSKHEKRFSSGIYIVETIHSKCMLSNRLTDDMLTTKSDTHSSSN